MVYVCIMQDCALNFSFSVRSAGSHYRRECVVVQVVTDAVGTLHVVRSNNVTRCRCSA